MMESSHAVPEGTWAQVHGQSCPGEASSPSCHKKYPNPVCLKEDHIHCVVCAAVHWMVPKPTLAHESRVSAQCLSKAVSSVQVLNIRKPPNAVPGGLLFITDPWVNSNHTLSPFCSSAMAKVDTVLCLCPSVAETGIRW